MVIYIYAFVTLNSGVEKTDELKKELVQHVRQEIGPIATPDVIHWAPALPKTRSGKIMRRRYRVYRTLIISRIREKLRSKMVMLRWN